ncbi:MAG: SemiSWEET transporter [Deltaproteobacteria bacterium]|jgi:MtN3 and saliva related transmembrane protein|nr:SemiSWEET transporter [Deltaproteobacteria bacterium]MBN2846332.1 SemiSWEET transporter [Deltaproteobacteria bacterium]
MNTATIIGLSAAFLSSISMIPQVIKVYRTKKTKDLSLGAFSVLAVGLFLWFVYGIMIQAIPVIIGNVIGFSLVCYIIVIKIRNG